MGGQGGGRGSFAIGGASVAYESAERDEKLGTAVDEVASDLKELADAVQSKVDSEPFEDSQNAIVSELEEVRDLVNAVANWAGAQEEIREEIREKLTDVGERVARLEGRLDQPHA